jgi:hypothetical protein
MEEFFIYLSVPEFLANYVKSIYGDPVDLPKDSVESRICKEILRKMPCDAKPDLGKDSNLQIRIPQFDHPDPRVYNWMSIHGKQLLQDSFFELLMRDFYKEMGSLDKMNCEINLSIYEFMDRHNMPLNAFDMFQKRFFRFKKKYQKNYAIKR